MIMMVIAIMRVQRRQAGRQAANRQTDRQTNIRATFYAYDGRVLPYLRLTEEGRRKKIA